MKWLRHAFDRGRRHWTDGRLRALKPLFEATENFFFWTSRRTAGPPHVRDPLDVKRYMTMVIVALAPATLAAVYFFGLRVLVMIAVSYAAGGAVEVLFACLRKEEINEGFLVTGLLFPLVLPPALPLWMVAVGVMFGVVVGKELFGGTGRNLFNPALVGRCFLALAYPRAMSGNWIEPGAAAWGRIGQYVDASTTDALSSATPLVLAKRGELADLGDLFLGTVPGSVGETSALAVIVGGLFLLIVGVSHWQSVAGLLGSFAALAAILHAVRPEQFAPVGWHLLAGSVLFGAMFMATDPVTSPVTRAGKWVYGGLIGISTVLIRNLTGYVEGVMFAILLGNIFAPVIDEVVIRVRIGRLELEE